MTAERPNDVSLYQRPPVQGTCTFNYNTSAYPTEPWHLLLSRILCLACDVFSFSPVGRSQHVYHVVCRELGEQTLTINIGNGVTLKNKFPASETTSVR